MSVPSTEVLMAWWAGISEKDKIFIYTKYRLPTDNEASASASVEVVEMKTETETETEDEEESTPSVARSELQTHIERLIRDVEKHHGLKLKVMTRRVFDERCRYVYLRDAAREANSFGHVVQIDKDTMIMWRANCPIPSGKISDPLAYTYFNKRGVVYISVLKKQDPTYAKRRPLLVEEFEKATDLSKSTVSIHKKQKRSAVWDESVIRRTELLDRL